MKHYTIRTYNFQESFKNHDFAIFCCEDLMKCHEQKKAYIPAFCLMPDHLHYALKMKKSRLNHLLPNGNPLPPTNPGCLVFRAGYGNADVFPERLFLNGPERI